jgi:tRNA dimethylallyltransferase
MPSADERTGKPVAAFIVGPTAAGKSALALELARRLDGEIVSADSRLLYRGMDIGTAKPTPADRALVPHHLIDVTDPDKPWSLAVFLQAALACFAEIRGRGRLPICTGGTGQYVRALLEGWKVPPAQSSPGLRESLERRAEAEGSPALYAELARLDPAAAERIDPRNTRRVVRALEVVLATGKPFSAQRARGAVPFRAAVIGLTLPRAELYARADARIDAMLAAGWVEEVRALLARGYSPDLPAFSALGYPQIARHLRGELTWAECVAEIRRATRVFIRRQANWFRPGDERIHWIDAHENAPALAEAWLRSQTAAAPPTVQSAQSNAGPQRGSNGVL